jgi:ABC-type uncharacterized transport system permease subunit/basic membrane lipoprotein Med (substrate-binding protein (PBP1-ABC) superfamily)
MQQSPDKLKVGLVTDAGPVADGTFNQLAYDGMVQAAEEDGLEYEVVETESREDFEANIRGLIAAGCNLIVTSGSTAGAVVERVAMSRREIRFVVFDYQPLPDSDNVTGLVFAEDEAGYMAGALAGLVTESCTVGFVGGMDVASVRKYWRGFERGLELTSRMAQIRHKFTGSFTDRDAGEAAARELISEGADVIFAAGAGSGSAAIRVAAQQGVWVIGVDQDEWFTTFGGGSEPGADRLLTSAVKRVDRAVRWAIGQAVQGRITGGVTRFDASGDGVGLAPYHRADTAVPSEVRGRILEISEALRSRKVRTGVDDSGEFLVEGFLPRLMKWDWHAAMLPFLAIFTALLVGAVFIGAFNPNVWEALDVSLGDGLGVAFSSVVQAYSALFEGAFGNPAKILAGLRTYLAGGGTEKLIPAFRPLTESLRTATPYIFAGLAVALGFRAGLFNIGAEGQYFIGGLTSVYVGYSVVGLPWFIHLPLSLAAGVIGGAFWAAIAGFLKAKAGAHEVINTIMLNYISYRLADYLLQVGGPMARPGDFRPISPEIQPSAYLPQFFPDDPSIRINSGLFLALLAVAVVYWLLFKTTTGLELRAVGANPRAARTAGISVARNYLLGMALSGGLAGLAGAHDILGVIHYMPNAFSSGYGFDSIALALLGKSHPVGVLLSALLFGFLRAGAQRMQAPPSFVPIDIISVLQGLIIVFIAAPEVVRFLYRLRAPEVAGEAVFTRGWGQA